MELQLSSKQKPLIMGILNVTPDSFSDGGRFNNVDDAVAQALLMQEQGADIIDIGGESTRPKAEEVPVAEEINRVLPVINKLKDKLNIPVSIDTRKAEVAETACEAGASIINDVSGLAFDENIIEVAKQHDAYLILMHMRGTPATMQDDLHYDDLIAEISEYLLAAAKKANNSGVPKEKLIIDPGIGFSKTVEHNFSIIKNIPAFKKLGYPVLIGASRKSFIGKTLDLSTESRVEGSVAAAVTAAIYGADIIRVHDVLQTVRAVKIAYRIKEAV